MSASPVLRPLASDFVENRRHLLLYDLADRLRRPEPTRFSTVGCAAEGVPEHLASALQQYEAHMIRVIGDGWWHGFEAPTFGPCGRRGLFLINAPLEQPLTNAYVADVRRDLQDFHLAYSAVELVSERPVRLAAADHELLLGMACGMRTEAVAAAVGLTKRGTEDRLKRTRDRLQSRTTVEAAAKAVALGLIL